jgi:hypothetical protein
MADEYDMRALSIRQPWAELILRGIKTVEYRSRPTRIIGERFWIYAAKGPPARRSSDAHIEGRRIWSRDLEMGDDVPKWMIELAEMLILGRLPTGVIVGSARIASCDQLADRTSESTVSGRQSQARLYGWRLIDVERATTLRKPSGHPQPMWFKPF